MNSPEFKKSKPKKTITVTVSKTVQTQQYEPVIVTVSETVEVSADRDSQEVHLETYKGVTKSAKKFIDNEIAKWTEVQARDKKRSKKQ